MKTRYLNLATLSTACFFFLSNATAQNLISNGDFSARLAGWSSTPNGTTTITFDAGLGNPAGSAALDRNNSTAADNANYLYQIVPVSSGSQYQLSADWQGDLLNGGTGRNWAEVYINFGSSVASLNPTINPGSILYKKATDGGPNEAPIPWTWEDITLSPNGGPSDGVFTASDSYMLVAFNLGGRAITSNNTQPGFFNVDNVSLTLWPPIRQPMFTNIVHAGADIILQGTNGLPNTVFQVVRTTDLTMSLTNWPDVGVGAFDLNGNFSYTDTAPAEAFNFYRLEALSQVGAPEITAQPQDRSAFIGKPANFSVTAEGAPPMLYQWYFNMSTLLPNATNSSYTLTSAQTNDAGTYHVIVINDYGSATSRLATLTVDPLPDILPGAFFVSPSGSDSNPGTEADPFLTIAKGLSTIAISGTLYLHGGAYAQPTKLSLNRTAVTNGAIRVWAYPGETPVINSSGNSSDGISVSGTGYHLKGLTVMNAGHNGINISGHHNIVENCVVHDNGNTGLHITGSQSRTTFPSYNLILNCDSYLNYDPPIGGNADGFSAKWDLGPGNVFRGCRAWWNSDDAWDLWMGNAAVLIEDCWAFWSGTNYWNSPQFNGNGNGFKLGGNYVGAPHRLLHCVAFENVVNGVDQNNNIDGQTIDQNTSWNNGGRNFNLNHGANTTPHVVRNNLSIAGGTSDSFTPGTLATNNSWQLILSPAANTADVLSVDPTVATAPRNPDGSLPYWSFLRPVPDGRLVDQGVDIGLPYNGTAPDLGAYESEP